MTGLRAAVEEYLAIRRALGFKLEQHGRLLTDFVGCLEDAGACTVTTELAMAWATRPQDADPAWWGQRLGVVRGFAKYLQAIDPAAEVPPQGVLPQAGRRATPYLYSEPEIARLMAAARSLAPPLRACTYATLVGLLAVTGMRVGEAIRVDRDDVDCSHGLVRVRHSKLDKSREVPLHHSTVDALRAYARLRDECWPQPKARSFFVSTPGNRLLYSDVHPVFQSLVRRAGLERRSQRYRPRLHDLRHSFAVRTLVGWYQAGGQVEARLPLLSTYLGHVAPASTYWYLSAAPELLALAGQRLQDKLGELP